MFDNLPPQSSPDWGPRVRKAAEGAKPEALMSMVDDDSLDLPIRFAAFYAAQVHNRRSHRYELYKQNVEKYYSVFEDQPMFTFMRAEVYGDVPGDAGGREYAIDLARKAVAELPATPGVNHLLAEYLLESIEIGAIERTEEARHRRLNEAERAVNRAISQSNGNYPKFFATKARILSQLGSYDLALQSLDRAIATEGASQSGSPSRIVQYQSYRRDVIAKRNSETLLREQRKAVEDFRSLRSELLSLLGLLAAVVAFISTSTAIALNLSTLGAVTLQVVTAGIILIVFAGFSLIFTTYGGKIRVLAAAGIGVSLVAVGVTVALVSK